MFNSPLIYFTDAVLRAPTIGCILMCVAAALVGVIVLLRKQSLLGEALSHAAYPGVILGVIIAGILEIGEEEEIYLALLIMSGAFLSVVAGFWSINFLERRLKVRTDSALCFVLSVFFGVGLTLISQVQFIFPSLYRQIQIYLYGQAATMTDINIVVYAGLLITVLLVICLFYKEIYVLTFDRFYAKSLGINTKLIDGLIFFLITLAVVIGIRSVGVVLMSAMLIAPAAAARQYTNKLYLLFILAALFGAISGFLGNYLSVEIVQLIKPMLGKKIALPTGPMIVIVASLICFFSLLFAPQRGILRRKIRVACFRYQCLGENLLKAIWRFGTNKEVSFTQIIKYQSISPWYLKFILSRLVKKGDLNKTKQGYVLSDKGRQLAAHIVRLHRLWEVYLVDFLGVGVERVHHSAEEMEHILTPALETQLTILLKDPKYDPHHQVIPRKNV